MPSCAGNWSHEPEMVTSPQIPEFWSNMQVHGLDNIFAQDVTSESLLPSSFGENDSLVDMVQ